MSILKRLGFVVVTIALLCGLFPLTSQPALAAGEGWLYGYQYRQGFNLSRAAGAVNDYQWRIEVHKGVGVSLNEDLYLDNKALSWEGTVPNDLRFTTSDGATEIDYWIETSDGTDATVWIEPPTVGVGATRFYAYYCRSNATTTSDGADTFIEFDGFEDLSGWVGDTGDFSSDGDIVTGTGAGAWKIIDNAWVVTALNKRVRYRTLYNVAANTSTHVRLENGVLNRYIMDRQNAATASDLYTFDGAGPTWEAFPENARGTWHTIELDWTNANIDYYADDVAGVNSPKVLNIPNDLTYYLSLGAFQNTIMIDWFFIGLYYPIELAWGAWEAEEEGVGLFDYVKSFLIEGSVDGILTDYPMRLLVHYGVGTDFEDNVYLDNNCQTDFDDLIFTNSDDGVLDYWVESYVAGISAIVWVEFDSIAADPADTLFYLWYGNADAVSPSNGDNTFDYFSDFDDLIGWAGDLGNYGVAAGIVTATETGAGNGWASINVADVFAANHLISYRWKLDSNTSHSQVSLWGATDFVMTKWHATSEPFQGYIWTREGVDMEWETAPEIVVNTYQVHRIDWYAASVVFRIDNVEVANSPLSAEVPNDADLAPTLGVYELDGWTMDWIFVGQQVANTPLWGDWEGASGTPTLTTVAATGVTYEEAQLNATLDAVGDSDVIVRGFDYGGGHTPFTVAIIPDTQGYVELYPGIFTQQINWILNNEDELNIKFVLHLGDIIETARCTGTDAEIEAEWTNAEASLSLLDGEIPYILAIGNHDYENIEAGIPPILNEDDSRDLEFFDDHFPVERFVGYSWFGGNYPATSMRNSYSFFDVDDQEFMVMSLEFLFDDDVMAWAAGILDANTDKHVIIVTHQYVSDQSAIDGLLGGAYYNFPTFNNPEDMWDDLFSDYSNICLIVNGHFINSGVGRVIYYTDGEPINQCLSNYQMEAMGGNGWLRYYEFNMGENEIEAVTFSPYLSQYKSGDTQRFTLQFRKEGDGFGPLARSVTTAGNYDTGAYSRVLTGLNEGCEYNFRAKAYNAQGWGYGSLLTFTTADADLPSVTTEMATSLGTTIATLQGTLVGLGEFTPVYVNFEYGTTVAYGTMTPEETMAAAAGFDADVIGLSPSTTYHFRARVRYGGENYTYGSDYTFTTPAVELLPPTNLTAVRGDGSIDLSWIKAVVGDNTLVRRSTSTYPNTPTEGVQVYLGINSSITDTGLDNAVAYYYSAWTEWSGTYSVLYAIAYSPPAGTGIGVIEVPDVMLIANAEVYGNYQADGDQLIVFTYQVVYLAGDPEEQPEDYFCFELFESGVLLARTPVVYWGHRPASIYLAPTNTITWGSPFTIELRGVEGQWEVIPEYVYPVTAYNWTADPTDISPLDIWVLDTARIIDDDWIVFTTSGDKLSEEASEVYARAIPALPSIRPLPFSSSVSYLVIPQQVHGTELQDDLTTANVGSDVTDALDDVGTVLGMEEPTEVGSMVMFFLALVVVVAIGFFTKSATAGLCCALPVMIYGNYIGLFPVIVTALTVLLLAILMIKSFWLERA